MVLELDIEQCISEDAGPPKDVDCDIPPQPKGGTHIFLQGHGNLSHAKKKKKIWIKTNNLIKDYPQLNQKKTNLKTAEELILNCCKIFEEHVKIKQPI